jgi:hypothetical protein
MAVTPFNIVPKIITPSLFINALFISALFISASTSVLNGTRVEPSNRNNPSDLVTINAVSSLNAQNIPTFAATGNNGSATIVGFPSCVNGVIGVGALAAFPQTPTVYNNFAGNTNRGAGLDLVAPGDISIVRYNGSNGATNSTSGATVIAASSYLKSTSTTFSDFASKLVKVLGHPYISK